MYNNYQSYNGYPQMQNNPYLMNQAFSPYGQQFNNSSNQFSTASPQQNAQPEVLQGTVVDSLDVVKAKNCNLDGTPTYYPKSDKTEIYCKQLNPQNGAGMILTYKLVNHTDTPEISTEQQVATLLSGFKADISNEIAELKELVLNNANISEAPQTKYSANKGGAKNA